MARVLDFQRPQPITRPLPDDPALLIELTVPLPIRQQVSQILEFKYDRRYASAQRLTNELQKVCRHSLYIQHEEVRKDESKKIAITGYMNICFVCGFHEEAELAVTIDSKKPIYIFEHFHKGKRLLVSRHAGNWTMGILYEPLVDIIKDVLNERARRKEVAEKQRKRPRA